MPRKFGFLAAAMLGVALTVSGLSMANPAPFEGPVEKQMEGINKNNTAIRKATKTVASWKKDGKATAKYAEEIVKLAKDAKKEKGPSEKVKKPHEEWAKLMDDLIKSAADYETLAMKSDATLPQAKEAAANLNKTCMPCHSIYREEDK
jgi:soluble cytochrome b562